MKLFEKLVNFFNKIFGRKKFYNNKLLSDGAKEDNMDFDSGFYSENNKNIEENEKKEFFRIYQAYKDGKIDSDKILLTDLIKIEMMMEKETIVLEEKITKTNSEIDIQNETLKKLTDELVKERNKIVET